MKVKVYDKNSKETETIELPSSLFEVSWNPDLVHRVFTLHNSNKRSNTAHSKERGEVSGGGKKPWRQKGTGRARHGSIRSPLWRGGGVTFGPRNDRNYTKKINKKMKRKALFSLLSKKLKDDEIKIIDTFELSKPKTKEVQLILNSFFGKDKASVLFVPSSKNKDFYLASKNIENAGVVRSSSLNIYDPLTYKFMFIEKKALDEIVSIWSNKEDNK
ncbi:MAG: 50S ribosomal protein L4 [Candidatus Paceibacterota bacterium]